MIPILGKSLEKIQHRIGKIQNRVGNLVTANVGSESVDFTPNRKVKYMYLIYMELTGSIITLTRDKTIIQCIDYALKSNDPTEIMLEISKQLNEDDEKIQSGFFSGKLLRSPSDKI